MSVGATPLKGTLALLRERFGDRVATTESVRLAHSRGEGFHAAAAPDAVVWPQSTQEVASILALCNAHAIPVIPFGAGTSLEGQVQAVRGGVCLNLSRMRRLIALNREDFDCRVEAGLDREGLNALLRNDGLFFPLDPGANATLGGMAATRASGTNAVRYGTMRDVTMGLTVVSADGEVFQLGARARKSSTGYDLVGLFVGSEGTLGVITELQLRLFGVPESVVAAVCQLQSLRAAVDAVCAALQLGIPLARIELLDELQMRASIQYSNLSDLAPAPTLFLEFHGSHSAVADQVRQVEALAAEFGASPLRYARDSEQRTALWAARHNAYWAARSLRPGCEALATDACVPISALPDCVLEAEAMSRAAGLLCPIAGHVGDGNFHLLILFDPNDDDEKTRADALSLAIARLALKYGGAISGEHGVGLHKRGLMREQHGEAVTLMSALKRALDPNGIMNPGKVLPA